MSVDTGAELLARIPLFRSLPRGDLQALIEASNREEFAPGEMIFDIGDPGSTLYLVESGLVKILLPSDDDEEILIALIGAGDFFGELSVFDGEKRSAKAEATEQTSVIQIARSDLLALIRIRPSLAEHLLASLARRLREADNSLKEAFFLDVGGRLAKKLLELSGTHGRRLPDGIEIAYPLGEKDLAELVGATRYTVAKYLGQFTDLGFIDRGGRHIVIKNPEGLAGRYR